MAAPREAVLWLALALASAVLVGCGQGARPDVNGKTGIAVDAQGRLLILAEICRGNVRGVHISGPNRGAIPNESKPTSRQHRNTESFRVDPAAAGRDWTGRPLRLPLTDELHIVIAYNAKRRTH